MAKEKIPDPGMNWFINELNVRELAENQTEMRDLLLVYYRVREVLQELEKEGLQIIKPDYIGSIESSTGRRQYITSMADFVIRKNNVELQLEIKLVSDEISLLPKDYLNYYQILTNNPNAQEILVTWNDKSLSTLTLSLAKIQELLTTNKKTTVAIESLSNLKEAIEQALKRYQPIWVKTTEIDFKKPQRYDLSLTFSELLRKNFDEYIKTADKRRYKDRQQALRSMSPKDIKLLERIFNESKSKKITTEDIEKIILDYLSRA